MSQPLPPRSVHAPFVDSPVPPRLQLSALWASVLFLYLYGDYFELYTPGKLSAMLAGRMALGVASPGALLGMAALMAVPSLLVAATLLLPVRLVRWINLGLGLLYTGIMLLAIQDSWPFYQLLGVVEMGLTSLIAWTAWRWPRQRALAATS